MHPGASGNSLSFGRSDRRAEVIFVASNQVWISQALDSILHPLGFAVVSTQAGPGVLDIVRAVKPDAIVVDDSLSDPDVFQFCRAVRDGGTATQATPVIVLSSTVAPRAEKIRAYSEGAWAFLPAPLDGEMLVLQLDNFLRAKRCADRHEAEKLVDEMTGLYSLRGLARRAREISADAVRNHTPVACVALAPSVKSGGDFPQLDVEVVLGHVVRALLETGRVSDVVGRCGEREIGVVAAGTGADGAERLVARLRAALERAPLQRDGRTVPLELDAGFLASEDLAQSPIGVMDMLFQASIALRSSPEGTGSNR